MLLASTGVPFPPGAAERAAALAAGGPVAVLSVARLHGYAFGLPNPGLLPTAKERAAQVEMVGRAVTEVQRLGCPADGQVVVTRNAGRAIARAARRRGVREVLVAAPEHGRLRRLVEGDPVAAVRRRIGRTTGVRSAVPRSGSGSAVPPSR